MEIPQHHRRRVRSSTSSQVQPASFLSNISAATAVEHHVVDEGNNEHFATGFADIYAALSPRQVAIIAIGSAIGTGLMITTGLSLPMGGPAALMISYTVVGFAVYLVLLALGEVAAWLPKPSTVADQARRFCDPALGFSLGWIYWLKYAIITPYQLTAAALVVEYWPEADKVNIGVWITLFLLVITALNYAHHALPSQVEFYVSSFKLFVMFVLMILSLVIALGGAPDRDPKGFRYWRDPGAFNDEHGRRAKAGFISTCGTMSSATFAYIGSERSGILAQTPNVRQAISRAVKYNFYRILVFHLLGVTLLGMILPRTSPLLAFSSGASKASAASPFVAALYFAGWPVIAHALNGCILLFVLSIANYDLYLATKAMCDLALKHRAPAFLLRVDRRGVPIFALGICSSLAMLAYVNARTNSTIVFGYFMNTVTMLGLLTWISILATHVSFVQARRAQGIPDDCLVFRSRFGLAGTCLALVMCLFISATMVFNCFTFDSRGHSKFDYWHLVASYVGVPLFVFLLVGHKLIIGDKRVRPKDVDFWSDRREDIPRQLEMEEIRAD
ncbi:Amino acid/polyamine transporter I [Penicillium hispanicum]|uniref:Amino acid/polyamine transporter I n=1 Tax=Penicillium hispanicum TaxID=1080232 RepID=UPI0025415568|nr:Amino acid/polyamine transporter I [Penicillium hispanicum]KAJ5573461.1 Amino acid/polyamine transporter I [Penicillium hispanicum]